MQVNLGVYKSGEMGEGGVKHIKNTADVINGRPLSWLRFPTTLKAID